MYGASLALATSIYCQDRTPATIWACYRHLLKFVHGNGRSERQHTLSSWLPMCRGRLTGHVGARRRQSRIAEFLETVHILWVLYSHAVLSWYNRRILCCTICGHWDSRYSSPLSTLFTKEVTWEILSSCYRGWLASFVLCEDDSVSRAHHHHWGLIGSHRYTRLTPRVLLWRGCSLLHLMLLLVEGASHHALCDGVVPWVKPRGRLAWLELLKHLLMGVIHIHDRLVDALSASTAIGFRWSLLLPDCLWDSQIEIILTTRIRDVTLALERNEATVGLLGDSHRLGFL